MAGEKQISLKMNRERNFQMDVLRVMACLLVVWQHVSEYYYIAPDFSPVREESTYVVGYLTSVCRAAVPLFVMVSGYFLLPMRGTTAEFFRRRCSRIIGPFVFWCVIYAVYFVFSRGDSWAQCLRNIMHIPVNFGTEVGHLWYVYMLLGLYLLVPVISPWLETASKKVLQAYLCLWMLTSLLSYIHLVFPEVLGECFWNPTPMLYYFTGFAGYFVLGFYLRRFGMPARWLSALMLTAGYALTALIFNSRIETAESVPALELSWQQCSGNVVMMAAGIFGLVGSYDWKGNGRITRLVSDMARKGYAIYLAHVIAVGELAKIMMNSMGCAGVEIPVISVISLAVTYIAVVLLAYIPKSEKWLGN